jgi:hypothetical protein
MISISNGSGYDAGGQGRQEGSGFRHDAAGGAGMGQVRIGDDEAGAGLEAVGGAFQLHVAELRIA